MVHSSYATITIASPKLTIASTMPRFPKQYSHDKQVWKDSNWELFQQRCSAQLTRMNLPSSQTRIPILGTSVLEDRSVGSYMGKLRGFVNDFLLPNPTLPSPP